MSDVRVIPPVHVRWQEGTQVLDATPENALLICWLAGEDGTDPTARVVPKVRLTDIPTDRLVNGIISVLDGFPDSHVILNGLMLRILALAVGKRADSRAALAQSIVAIFEKDPHLCFQVAALLVERRSRL